MLSFDYRSLFVVVCFVAVLSSVASDTNDTANVVNFPADLDESTQNGETNSVSAEAHSEAKMINSAMQTLSNGSVVVETVEVECVDGNCTRKSNERIIPAAENKAAEEQSDDDPIMEPLF